MKAEYSFLITGILSLFRFLAFLGISQGQSHTGDLESRERKTVKRIELHSRPALGLAGFLFAGLCVLVCLAIEASGLADSNSPPALLSVSTNLPASQKLTPEEAEQALTRLRETIPGRPGTWRSTTLEFEPDPRDTNVIPGWLASSN